AGDRTRRQAPADAIARLEDDDAQPGRAEAPRTHQAGQAGADHDRVVHATTLPRAAPPGLQPCREPAAQRRVHLPGRAAADDGTDVAARDLEDVAVGAADVIEERGRRDRRTDLI